MPLKVVQHSGDSVSGIVLPVLQEDNCFDQQQQQQQHKQQYSSQKYGRQLTHSSTSSSNATPQRRNGKHSESSSSSKNQNHSDVEYDNEAYAQGEFLDSERSGHRTVSSDSGGSLDGSKRGYTNRNITIFENARIHINPGRIFRLVTEMYAERKLVVVALVHFVCTMVIWTNFFLKKFDQQKNNVPEEAPFYWWKRVTPPLEFGAMHAILFQMGIIPFTMSRLTIATASNTGLNRFIPFNRSQRIHIHLGYTWFAVVFFSTILFFMFFGLMCANGEEKFCAKFRSEIIITGYLLFATCLAIGGTSYFRDKIPYEIFYGVHHLVFIMYALAIIHTLDAKGRADINSRSQTFRWFTIPLIYYFCDRAAMNINHRYWSRVEDCRLAEATNGSKMIVMKLRRPSLFQFEPGQYAYIKCPGIDRTWHPFSIASDPTHTFLEFYIEVQDHASWTDKLWVKLGKSSFGVDSHDAAQFQSPGMARLVASRRASNLSAIKFEVMGPFGTRLGKSEDYSHGIAIGSGTGVVPVISEFKKHVRQLLRLHPDHYVEEQLRIHKRIVIIEKARTKMRGSLFGNAIGTRAADEREELQRLTETLRNGTDASSTLPYHAGEGASSIAPSTVGSIMSMGTADMTNPSLFDVKKAAFKASLPVYGVVYLCTLPVFGILMIGLTISWSCLPFDLSPAMKSFLELGTFMFQAAYAVVAIGFWDRNSMFMYIDVAAIMCFVIMDAFWNARADWGDFSNEGLTYYVLLHGYMTGRLWTSAVKPRHQSARNMVVRHGARSLDHLHFIWVTRSAIHVSKIAPDIIGYWDALVAAWGIEKAQKVCRISIYITDRDKAACALLKKDLVQTSLHNLGCFHFTRPDFQRIFEQHSLDRIDDRRRPTSQTLLTFCGSPQLSSIVSEAKINVDILTTVTGNKWHQTDYVSESYGAFKSNASSGDGHGANFGESNSKKSDNSSLSSKSDHDVETVSLNSRPNKIV